ncbi:vesicular inhibitory amino acid transporter-like [Siniperca chuatsi]|uniref:vesicular inhibitory amino acid transporter-like n=1 Tax=Siniperca chuatsi TaxID=119488 RepID=UPI001CE1FBA9|nr:vesicular inhibitory amino acid transporter-like [Siniperca chuatsi]
MAPPAALHNSPHSGAKLKQPVSVKFPQTFRPPEAGRLTLQTARLKMGSLHRAQSSRQPWSASGSLWGWALSRLHLDWTTRFFQEDEETLILTHSDELNRTYCEDNRLPCDSITNKNNTGSDYTRRNKTSFRRSSLSLIEQDNSTMRERPAPNLKGSSSTLRQESPAFKETRATVISTGPSSITITSAVSTADSLLFKNTRRYGKGRRSSEMQADKMGSNSEENPSFNQNQGNKTRSYRLAGLLRGNMQKLRLSEDREELKELEKTVEGTSQLCINLEEERARMSFANPVQSPHTGTTGLNPTATLTAWEAGWNVTNAIQGIFVLGLPFALVQSGYLGLVLLVLSAWVCNHTGRILVTCLYEEEQCGGSGSVSKVRVRHSYQDIVEACCKGLWPNCPGLGGWMVNVAQVIELLMTCTLYLVVSTSLLSDSLSGMDVPRSVCSLVSLMFLLPCLLLTDLRPVSTLSLLCSLAHILISLLVMLYCLSRASSWSWSCLSLSVDPEDFLVSVGVIIFSYTSQIFLPPLEGSMEDRGQFNAMLAWTHGAACIMKTMFSLLAVLTWGAETSEVITDNLPSDLQPLVNLSLLAKALLSYPLPFYSAAEILQTCLLGDAVFSSYSKHGGEGVSRPALLVRGAMLMTSYLLALLVPRFSLLMGLTGSVTGAAMTLILPCLFHLRLQWGRLTVRDRLIDVCILSLGVICSVSGVICSVKRLVEGL